MIARKFPLIVPTHCPHALPCILYSLLCVVPFQAQGGMALSDAMMLSQFDTQPGRPCLHVFHSRRGQ